MPERRLYRIQEVSGSQRKGWLQQIVFETIWEKLLAERVWSVAKNAQDNSTIGGDNPLVVGNWVILFDDGDIATPSGNLFSDIADNLTYKLIDFG